MTSKTRPTRMVGQQSGSQQSGGLSAATQQMGGGGDAAQAQQAGGAPAQAGQSQKPVRYTDWASI